MITLKTIDNEEHLLRVHLREEFVDTGFIDVYQWQNFTDYFKIELNNAKKGMIKIEDVKLWLEQFEQILNWHKERSLLPYDWNEYEHKKIIELREMLGDKQ